jgi:NTP pyrophosphatase (non-canonical NTP hydrolase)
MGKTISENLPDDPMLDEDYNYDEYVLMVASLTKSGTSILAELTPQEANLWHMGTGVSGEAGELLDAIKAAVIYRKPLDVDNVIEELGDLEFFMEGLRQAIGVSREHVLEQNMAKLAKRYEGFKYSNAAAQERADKAAPTFSDPASLNPAFAGPFSHLSPKPAEIPTVSYEAQLKGLDPDLRCEYFPESEDYPEGFAVYKFGVCQTAFYSTSEEACKAAIKALANK